MKADSTDLRQRIIAACDARDGTRPQIAHRFCVSIHFVRKLLRQRRDTGSVALKARGGGHPRAFNSEASDRLRQAVRAHHDATLVELARATGVVCSPSAVYRQLQALGITRSKSRGGRPSKIAST